MKRAPQLAPLSREHHVALELSLRLRRAGETEVELVRQAAASFWETECRRHFELEEELLLPVLASHTGSGDPDIRRTLAEHRRLSERFVSFGTPPSPSVAMLNETGTLLSEHVRFEERVLFPRVEALLEPDELSRLGAQLDDAAPDRTPPRL